MALWAGVVLSIVGLFGGGISVILFRELDALSVSQSKLDDKLQQEYRLANATIAQNVENVDKVSRERHDDAIGAINRMVSKLDVLQTFVDHGVERELDELRQRRLEDRNK